MKKISTQFLTLLFAMLFVSCTQGGTDKHDHSKHKHSENKATSEANLKAQEKCPIKGGKIDKDVYSDYKGHRIYYCCPGCDKTFLKNPDKYISQMKADGVSPAKLQSECPVSGDEIDDEIFAQTAAGKIYVCCKKCKSKVEASPEKYISMLKKNNIAIGSVVKSSGAHKDHDHSKHKH